MVVAVPMFPKRGLYEEAEAKFFSPLEHVFQGGRSSIDSFSGYTG
jgi:hypothetical protein